MWAKEDDDYTTRYKQPHQDMLLFKVAHYSPYSIWWILQQLLQVLMGKQPDFAPIEVMVDSARNRKTYKPDVSPKSIFFSIMGEHRSFSYQISNNRE